MWDWIKMIFAGLMLVIGGIVCVLFAYSILVFPFVLWTDRTLDFWVTYLKGTTVDVPFWLSFIVTIVFNAVILLINVISEVARLCI